MRHPSRDKRNRSAVEAIWFISWLMVSDQMSYWCNWVFWGSVTGYVITLCVRTKAHIFFGWHFSHLCVKRLIGWCMLCVWLLTFSIPLHDVCGVALTLSRTALMHLETAGEGPTNQVLQLHKSIARLSPLLCVSFIFAVILLLDCLIDVVHLFQCLYVFILDTYNCKN